jgi:hypothetical protein
MSKLPLRELVLVLASTVKVTVPLPLPLLLVRIQPKALLAVQLHPLFAFTLKLPLPPAATMEVPVGEIE